MIDWQPLDCAPRDRDVALLSTYKMPGGGYFAAVIVARWSGPEGFELGGGGASTGVGDGASTYWAEVSALNLPEPGERPPLRLPEEPPKRGGAGDWPR